jgi:hypothetical protein
LRRVEVNGGPGELYLDAGRHLIAAVALDIAGGQISSINSIVNPDKLAHLGTAPATDPYVLHPKVHPARATLGT